MAGGPGGENGAENGGPHTCSPVETKCHKERKKLSGVGNQGESGKPVEIKRHKEGVKLSGLGDQGESGTTSGTTSRKRGRDDDQQDEEGLARKVARGQ